MIQQHYQLVVLGGGSGGLGAAISAARAGLRVLLVEKEAMLGGTSTTAGVSCWEPGVGGTGIPFEIYQRLKKKPNSVGIYSFGRHFSWQDGWHWPHALDRVNFPGCETILDATCRYNDTLRRHPEPGKPFDETFQRKFLHGVVFEPEAFSSVVAEMIEETGCCPVLLSTRLITVTREGSRLISAELSGGIYVTADYWIDATGDACLCEAAGCELLQGRDPQTRFHEPSAPEQGNEREVNGVTLIFRATPCADPHVEAFDDAPATCWWATAFPPVKCDHFPTGDLLFNMLPTMSGEEYLTLDRKSATAECQRRVHAQWRFLQTNFKEFQRYRLSWIAPALGVRETRRVVCETMLTEHDLRAGLMSQTAPDLVAIADHPCDTHRTTGGGTFEIAEPYGIPYRCLIPQGLSNLLIASRGAGFSSIAASSCRLSRTMIQLGQAAGTAAALAVEVNCDFPAVPADPLRQRLRDQHVQLDWPMPPLLREYIVQNEN